eukprot:4414962-Pleurochrysis_carterae.AAC.1
MSNTRPGVPARRQNAREPKVRAGVRASSCARAWRLHILLGFACARVGDYARVRSLGARRARALERKADGWEC